jgi:hypothetical protein
VSIIDRIGIRRVAVERVTVISEDQLDEKVLALLTAAAE